MELQELKLHNFRRYRRAEMVFSDGVHVIYGQNGSGKTTILEAIHYLTLTRSFRTTTEKHLIHHQENLCRVEGIFRTTNERPLKTTLAYALDSGKHLTVNGQKIHRFSEYIGEVPVVLLHPNDLNLSQGGPSVRRRFLDILLSQSSKLYLHHLIEYNRSLRQRNQQLQSTFSDVQLLIPWEENLIHNGCELILKREETIEQLSQLVKHFYKQLSQLDDEVKILYRCTLDLRSELGLKNLYRSQFEQKRRQEKEQGTTLIGPHRDDMLFLINGKPMRTYASQGEHKTFVIALKLAEYELLQRHHSQPPILLFDDIFGELDAGRIQLMLRQLSDIGQVFVTTTSRNFFDKIQDFRQSIHYFEVKHGLVKAVS